ncbi:MAG: hypothetical protein DRP83_07315, partial [Planctomycetota bacterium]
MSAIVESLNFAGLWFVKFALPMLIQSSLLIVVILLLDRVVRKKVRAVVRYALWMLVLLKLVLPVTLAAPTGIGYWIGGSFLNPMFEASAQLPAQAEMQSTAQLPEASPATNHLGTTAQPGLGDLQNSSHDGDIDSLAGGALPAEQIAAADAEFIGAMPVSKSAGLGWAAAVFLAWLTVVAGMILLIVQRSMFVAGLVRQGGEAGGELAAMLEECKRRLGVNAKKRVKLKLSSNATSPAVCGLFQPVILIPQNLPARLSSRQLEAVLLHELAHIKRYDLWVNMAQALLQIFYFYNPLLWLANAIIRRLREQAVDEAVLVAMGKQASEYPETLLNVATLLLGRPALSLRLIGVVESQNALSLRIKHILSRPLPKSAKLGTLGLLILLLTAAVLLPMARATQKPATEKPQAEEPEKTEAPVGEDFLTGVVFINNHRYGPDNGAVSQLTKTGKMTCGHPGAVSEVSWKWLRDTPPGDEYEFTRIFPAGAANAKTHKNIVTYDGSHASIWKDDFQEIVIRRDKPAAGKSDFKVNLPSGVTVELLGVCFHRSKSKVKQWWWPDGTTRENGLYR